MRGFQTTLVFLLGWATSAWSALIKEHQMPAWAKEEARLENEAQKAAEREQAAMIRAQGGMQGGGGLDDAEERARQAAIRAAEAFGGGGGSSSGGSSSADEMARAEAEAMAKAQAEAEAMAAAQKALQAESGAARQSAEDSACAEERAKYEKENEECWQHGCLWKPREPACMKGLNIFGTPEGLAKPIEEFRIKAHKQNFLRPM